ncbi:PREDICTED: alpha-1,4 glucan phosphorylase L isozyme, chloroplastic/amyloplastic-like [Fragaria vesca subsp. vesca]|uniref:alpha-1,4 glucan phosphorylase L isozyme, chloroplastic/amyloplastic-like n=1 Tax=Fragaria vesca subsp. vesca TaxID=101020 RepID=UPI0002C34413|nr:PREDICTED: alpha-1,4 glucan phosphorylase L isozyme, chloroplastic/amyloplastic-like [Fragaria vesca subsp. vesca]
MAVSQFSCGGAMESLHYKSQSELIGFGSRRSFSSRLLLARTLSLNPRTHRSRCRRSVLVTNVIKDPTVEQETTLSSCTPDAVSIASSIKYHAEFTPSFSPEHFELPKAYFATAQSVRDALIVNWNATNDYYEKLNVKQAYYLSMEFLQGRALLNAVGNLELAGAYAEALSKLGHKLETVAHQEPDAALGNGGLGRLASCFLDSLATLNYPAWGYGLRYKYGLFKQRITKEGQEEAAEDWLEMGNPWEILRNDVSYHVKFYGNVATGSDGKRHWIGGEDVVAVAYDVPIPGYKTKTTINLRLWSTKALSQDFDLYSFNSGEHTKAFEALANAEKICYVLYPGDDSLEGKTLRLKQQYTLCSASLQDIVARFERRSGANVNWEEFPKKVAVQMNDTHPTLCIPELIRILMDLKGLTWKEAWSITQRTVAYTNHTVLPEALEKWSLELMQKLLPRHVEIIELIDEELINTIVSEYGTSDCDLLEKKLKEMRILENVDLPPTYAKLLFQPKKGSSVLPTEKLEDSNKDEKLEDSNKDEKLEDSEKDEKLEDSNKDEKLEDSEKDEKLEDSNKDEKLEDSNKDEKLEDSEKDEKLEDSKKDVKALDEEIEPKKKPLEEKKKASPKPPKLVRMANLCVVGGHAVNGVAEIHSEIVKDEVFNSFYKLWPKKFQNKTNGVTPRRWIRFCNPDLSSILTKWIGTEDWVLNTEKLAELRQYADDGDLQTQWRQAKRSNKLRVVSFIKERTGYSVSPDAMFDIQVKRIHEYKRQLMNILGIVYRYKKMKEMSASKRKAEFVPRVCMFGGKAFATYVQAKRIVKFITDVGETVNHDPSIGDLLKVIFVPDYNVSVAELLIPASELSQHISTAGMEASGTSNMKFAMNGCILIGTLDGANVEIREEVGADNFFLFGAEAHEIAGLRKERAEGKFVPDPRFEEVKEFIRSGVFGSYNYDDLIGSLEGNEGFGRADYFLVGKDFPSYIECQEKVDEAYRDQKKWTKMSILNTAGSSKFSSDRTIHEYAKDIWNINPVELQ